MFSHKVITYKADALPEWIIKQRSVTIVLYSDKIEVWDALLNKWCDAYIGDTINKDDFGFSVESCYE